MVTKLVALLLLSSRAVLGLFSFPFTGSTCTTAKSYFDVSGLLCSTCATNEKVNEDASGCTCSTGYRRLYSSATVNGLDFGTCTSCIDSGLSSSSLGTYCTVCDTSSGPYWSPAKLVATAADIPSGQEAYYSVGDCICTALDGEVSEADAAGVPFLVSGSGGSTYVKRCVTCGPNSVAHQGKCFTCPYPKVVSVTGGVGGGPTCVCPTTLPAGVKCSALSDIDYVGAALGVATPSFSSVVFRGVARAGGGAEGATTDVTVISALFQSLLPPAARACLDLGDRPSCNALANLCVLQMYDDATPACQLYNKIVDVRKTTTYYTGTGLPWPLTLPWLFYPDGAATYLEATDVALKAVLAEGLESQESLTGVGRLTLVASTYAANGTWLGLRPLSAQLQLCGAATADGQAYEKVGQGYSNSCQVDVSDILDAARTDWGVELMDLYLYDGPGRLYPLPIINRDLRRGSSFVNRAAAAPAVLVRRLFVVDQATGVQAAGAPPSAVRFLQSATLTIPLRKDRLGRIYPPRLDVAYAAVDPASVAGALSSTAARQGVKFEVGWTMPATRYNEFEKGILVTACVLAGLYWLVRVNSILRLRRDPSLDLGLMYRALMEGADVFGSALLIHLFIMAMYWFSFFKTQKAVYMILPPESEMSNFKTILVIAAIFKSAGVADALRRQLGYDVLFLDWEKPKKLLAAGGTREVSAPTSCWRTMLVANEWNELQTLRKSHPGFSFLLLVCLLEGARWGGVGNATPDEKMLNAKPYLSSHFVLRFGISALLYLAIAGTQIVLNSTIIKLYFSDPLGNFVDMCYLANVSVFVLDERCSGYYIHGRNAMKMSDTDFLGLSEELRKEEQQTVSARGLIPAHSDKNMRENQAFEIFIDDKTRFTYEDTLVRTLERALEVQKQASGLLGRLKSPELASSAQLAAMKKASAFVKGLLADVEANYAERVVMPSLLQRVMAAPPVVQSFGQSLSLPPMVLVHDFRHRFGHLFLYNREGSMAFMEFLVFAAVDMGIRSYAASAFVAYLIQAAYVYVRAGQGTNNVSRKSLIDPRFLI